jgi:hypothetical protein
MKIRTYGCESDVAIFASDRASAFGDELVMRGGLVDVRWGVLVCAALNDPPARMRKNAKGAFGLQS